MRLASTSDAACTQCHSNLKAHDKNSPPKFAGNIKGFDGSHPEFGAVQPGHEDPGTVAFNHMKHLKKELDPLGRPINRLRGPHGAWILPLSDGRILVVQALQGAAVRSDEDEYALGESVSYTV